MEHMPMRAPLFRRISALVLAAIVLTATVVLFFSMRQVNDVAIDALEEAALSGRNRIREWFSEKELMLQMLAAEMRFFSMDDKAAIEDHLSYYFPRYEFMVDVYVGTPDNRMYSGTRWTPTEGYDVRNRDWYIGAKMAGGLAYTRPYLDAMSGEIVITLSVPIVDRDGRDMGVMGLDVTLRALTEFVSGVEILGAPGRAFLLDGQQNIIAHESADLLPTIVDGEGRFVSLWDAGYRTGANLADGDIALSRGASYDGRDSYISLGVIENNGWVYGFHVPASDFRAVYIELGIAGILAVVILGAVALVLASRLTDWMLRPVGMLLETTESFLDGDVSDDADNLSEKNFPDYVTKYRRAKRQGREVEEVLRRAGEGDYSRHVAPLSEKDSVTIELNALLRKLSARGDAKGENKNGGQK